MQVTRAAEPESAMLMQLERLYDRIIANLTGAIHKLYKAKPELDIRDTLKGIFPPLSIASESRNSWAALIRSEPNL